MLMGLKDAFFRSLPLFKGKERLAKMLFSGQMSDRDFWIRGKYGCEYLIPNIVENIGFEIFINGIYEQRTSDFIVNHLPEKGVFLDLGANVGAITIPVQTTRNDVQVICVEAAPWIYEYLVKNLSRNHAGGVRHLNKALFYTDDEILNFYSPLEKFGKGSLSPVFSDTVIPVTTIKVDTLVKELNLDKVDLIKIDVEGYEYHVFKGAAVLLGSENAPDIIFEFVDWAEKAAKGAEIGSSQKILREMGYKIFYFNGKQSEEEVTGILTKGFFMLYATKKLNK